MAYIYKITNDINDKVYIGKTEFSIEKRWKEHCKDYLSRRKEKRPLYNAMRKYGIEHFNIELIEETSNAEEREMFWIKHYDSFRYGYNATIGGDGKRYLDYDLIISNYEKYRNASEVARQMEISSDTVLKVLKSHNIPIVPSQEIIKQNGKPVTAYDKVTLKYVKQFPSYMDAARWLKENNLTNCKLTTIRSHISEVVRGKRKSAAGFIWK